MKTTKLILTLSVIIALVSVVLLVITLDKYGITGFTSSTDTAYANLTIAEQASLRFTDAECSFGSGTVQEEPIFAYAYSNGTGPINGTGWAGCSNGLTVRNDGDIDLSVALTSDVTAAQFIGGDRTTPSFKVKSTNTSTCTIAGAIGTFTEFSGSLVACANLTYAGTGSEGGTLLIDFELKIPEDAIGTKGAVITATGTAI